MSSKNTERRLIAIRVASIAAILSLPLGYLIGLGLSEGQGGPGRAVGSALGYTVTIVVWVIALLVVLWNLRGGLQDAGRKTRIFMFLSIAILPASVLWSAVSSQSYTMRVMNESGLEIAGVSVQMAERHASFGAMRSESIASASGFSRRPATYADISWTDDNDQSHTARVDLSGIVPRRYDDGVLTFVIEPDAGVSVGFFIDRGPGF